MVGREEERTKGLQPRATQDRSLVSPSVKERSGRLPQSLNETADSPPRPIRMAETSSYVLGKQQKQR